jgi:uncharacterized protein
MATNRLLHFLAAGVLIVQAQLRADNPNAPEENETLGLAEISTVGLDVLNNSPVVLLRDVETGQVVPIWVGLSEAQAIARALHDIKMPRPMTHDLLADMVKQLGAAVEEVRVHDFRNGMYFGMIRLKQEGKEELIEVDSRPSDAMALALRVGAPIQLSKKVLKLAPEFDFVAPDEAEQVVRALGITVVAPTEPLRKEFGLGGQQGVIVSAVSGVAEEKGLRRGDLIVEVNELPIENPMEFFEQIRKQAPLGPVEIKFLRKGEEQTIELPVEIPDEPEPLKRRERAIQV